MSDKLLDSWEEKLSSWEEVKKALAEFDARTKNERTSAGNTKFLTRAKSLPETEKGIPFFVIDKTNLDMFEEEGVPFDVAYVPREKLPKQLLEENDATTGILYMKDKKLFFMSQTACLTLLQQAGCAGDYMVNGGDLYRNIALFAALIRRRACFSAVTRTEAEKDIGKCFAAFAEKHCHSGLALIVDIMENVNYQVIFSGGSLTNKVLTLKFLIKIPDRDEASVAPGIIIEDSDTGYSLFTVHGVYFMPDGSYAIQETIGKKHSSLCTPETCKAAIETVIENIINDDVLDRLGQCEIIMPRYNEIEIMAESAYRDILSISAMNEVRAEIEKYNPPFTLKEAAIKAISLQSIFESPAIKRKMRFAAKEILKLI